MRTRMTPVTVVGIAVAIGVEQALACRDFAGRHAKRYDSGKAEGRSADRRPHRKACGRLRQSGREDREWCEPRKHDCKDGSEGRRRIVVPGDCRLLLERQHRMACCRSSPCPADHRNYSRPRSSKAHGLDLGHASRTRRGCRRVRKHGPLRSRKMRATACPGSQRARGCDCGDPFRIVRPDKQHSNCRIGPERTGLRARPA